MAKLLIIKKNLAFFCSISTFQPIFGKYIHVEKNDFNNLVEYIYIYIFITKNIYIYKGIFMFPCLFFRHTHFLTPDPSLTLYVYFSRKLVEMLKWTHLCLIFQGKNHFNQFLSWLK